MAPQLAPVQYHLRAAVRQRWPGRDTRSDGWLGDADHQLSGAPESGGSAHNPNGRDLVDAQDIDSGPGTHGPTVVAAAICTPGTRYVIHRGRIYHARDRFRPRTYTGNPHSGHIHTECEQTPDAEQSTPDLSLLIFGGPFWPTLRIGADSTLRLHVRQLQAFLNAQGGALVVDGAFGPLTDTAVRAFQRAAKAAGGVDGIVGAGTRSALRSVTLR